MFLGKLTYVESKKSVLHMQNNIKYQPEHLERKLILSKYIK